MAVKFHVVLDGKILIAITWCNLIQELSEVADVTLLMSPEVDCDEDNSLIWQSVASFGIIPETDIKMNPLFFDEHIETNLVFFNMSHSGMRHIEKH